jgi:hypothetical protein
VREGVGEGVATAVFFFERKTLTVIVSGETILQKIQCMSLLVVQRHFQLVLLQGQAQWYLMARGLVLHLGQAQLSCRLEQWRCLLRSVLSSTGSYEGAKLFVIIFIIPRDLSFVVQQHIGSHAPSVSQFAIVGSLQAQQRASMWWLQYGDERLPEDKGKIPVRLIDSLRVNVYLIHIATRHYS